MKPLYIESTKALGLFQRHGTNHRMIGQLHRLALSQPEVAQQDALPLALYFANQIMNGAPLPGRASYTGPELEWDGTLPKGMHPMVSLLYDNRALLVHTYTHVKRSTLDRWYIAIKEIEEGRDG